MEKNKVIIIGLVTLIVGLALGFGAATLRGDNRYGMMDRDDMHMMSDGNVMQNNNSMMGGKMSMSNMMMGMNAELKGKTGDAFDQAFLAEMIVHHQGAVEMANLALTNAKHQEIKDLAKGIIEAQNKEIAEMQAWNKTWYNK